MKKLIKNKKEKIKIYLSMNSRKKGGGSNSFVINFKNSIKKSKKYYKLEKKILRSDKVIIIANYGNIDELKQAKKKGCFIIHRLDEFFEKNESEVRKIKHIKIIEINKYADITVFQSNFVFNNVQPFINAKQYQIIINGGDINRFFPGNQRGDFIGHVSWSYDKRKRYDFILDTIKKYPKEQFLLIGNHLKSNLPFNKFNNAKIIGPVSRKKITKYYQKMKMLILPSENDPCPNTAVEAILSGVPVCYNKTGGTKEIVKDCGLPLAQFYLLLNNLEKYRNKCLKRKDLDFGFVAKKYMMLN